MNSMENQATHLDKDNSKTMDYSPRKTKSNHHGKKETNLCPYCLSREFQCVKTKPNGLSVITITGFELTKIYHCEICGYTDERLSN